MIEKHNTGLMNYVERAKRSEKDITNEEMGKGKSRLIEIMEEYRPRIVCFVGKKCCKYTLYVPRTNNEIKFGIQERDILNVAVYCLPHGSKKDTELTYCSNNG